ncbi:MATE family efflux transporter [Pleionea sediminis]|uniref:MATE family efflux transporter n=1 Tax=Pleionea sediminis TaxID=2569479 RepID=UPI001185082D|nr:MATE family efflux transporter [Pleionea sediminis]
MSRTQSSPTQYELTELFKLGLPAVLAQISQMSLGVIDTMMAGQVNPEALAAIAVGTNILNPVIVFILGVFLALNPIVSHLNGRGDLQQIGVVFQHSLVLGILLALPSIYFLNNSLPLMESIEIQSDLTGIVHQYLQACSYGIIPLFMFFALRFCNEGLFSNRAIMVVSIIAIPFNILFNFWFIWGGLGIPAMGAVGVGYATSTVWFIMFVSLGIYTIKTPRYKHLAITDQLHRFNPRQIKEIFRLGLPMGIGVGMEIAMFAFIGLLIGRYEVTIVASHQIAINIASMAYMVPLGLSIAISARVGFYAGREDVESLKLAGKTGILTAIGLAIMSAMIIFFTSTFLAELYTDDIKVITLAASLLYLAAIFQLSDAIQVSISGALRGLKDTQIPMVISAIAYWLIGFPVGYYFAEYSQMGVRGYWMGIIAGLTAAAILLFFRYQQEIDKFQIKQAQQTAEDL